MESTPSSTPAQFAGSPKFAGLKELFQRHPIASAAGIWATSFVFTLAVILITRQFFPGADTGLVGIAAQTLALIAVLTALRWWRETGFNAPREWRDLRLLLLPAAVIIIPPFLAGVRSMEPATFWYLAVGYLLTGFTEEGIFRGLILKVLRPTGAVRAAVLSAVLFGLMHLVNLLIRGNPAIVLAQCVGAFCDGVGFAALRMRTNTIWPLVILHMLHDLLLKFTQLPAIPLDVAQVTILMIYGFYLLRTRKTLSGANSPAAA